MVLGRSLALVATWHPGYSNTPERPKCIDGDSEEAREYSTAVPIQLYWPGRTKAQWYHRVKRYLWTSLDSPRFRTATAYARYASTSARTLVTNSIAENCRSSCPRALRCMEADDPTAQRATDRRHDLRRRMTSEGAERPGRCVLYSSLDVLLALSYTQSPWWCLPAVAPGMEYARSRK